MSPREATPSDYDLIRAFVRGDGASLGTLAERYEQGMLGLALGLMNGRREAALDAVQEAWVRVIRHASGFDGRSSVKTWIYRILINRCHDLRQAARRGAGEGVAGRVGRGGAQNTGEARGDGPEGAGSLAPRGGDDAAEAARVDEDRAALRGAVAGLPDGQQTVLLLCYHTGMSHAQAAEILGLPLGTLKSRLHSALENLRGELARGRPAGEPEKNL